MDFGKAFTFAFDDADWVKKLGIAGLLMIIPIVGWLAVGGWAIEVTRRIIHREPQLLPEWNNFGDFLMKGLMVFVIGFVYSLPTLLISGCQQGVVLALQNNNNDNLAIVVTILAACFGLVSLVYGIFLGFVLPAAYGNYAATGQLGAAFRFGDVFRLVRSAPTAYLIVLLGSILAGLISAAGLIVCFIGVLFTAAYAMLIQAHLWGQAYNVAKPSGMLAPETSL
jgi:hypothetical protein